MLSQSVGVLLLVCLFVSCFPCLLYGFPVFLSSICFYFSFLPFIIFPIPFFFPVLLSLIYYFSPFLYFNTCFSYLSFISPSYLHHLLYPFQSPSTWHLSIPHLLFTSYTCPLPFTCCLFYPFFNFLPLPLSAQWLNIKLE